MNNLLKCRICGWKQDDYPWGEDGDTPSFNICDCCGVEFGYEDSNLVSIRKYRNNWIENGAKWNFEDAKPKYWKLNEQLKNIPPNYL